MLSPVLAKFLSGEKFDPLKTPYPSAFQRVIMSKKREE
ncbi:hypothetical protein PORCRE_835 [Porphyromonas crevioricanis JCM 15906]|uniref:Uncharacterized protein n=1 Tax=Porphyromonas crevioricanis JCM 15906 TaxID=1305617 RepID=T1DR79_9PORP|nr:hypothetical protein PORCRE_835 [Porphyromonas crevioricanis JCM 15906]GAD07088.1 hypothetical protein PORCAN_705 [Porphyromonas crevioricanis JCM 13913]